MNRDSESRLLAFCITQRGRFDAAEWAQFSAVTRAEVAATARYLAGVSWYGHEASLRAMADALGGASFAALVRETGFDPGRFGGLLQAHLRQAGRAVAATADTVGDKRPLLQSIDLMCRRIAGA